MSRVLISGLAIIMVALASFSIIRIDARRRTYDDYSVIRSLPKTREQLQLLRELYNKSRQRLRRQHTEKEEIELDFWTEPNKVNAMVDVLVSPRNLTNYLTKLSNSNIPCYGMFENLGKEINTTKTGLPINLSSNKPKSGMRASLRTVVAPNNFYSLFQRYSAIEYKLKSLSSLDKRMMITTIGKSFENRNIYLVKVSNNHTANKPVILMDAGHHAREWISHSTILYIIESLFNKDMPKIPEDSCNSMEKCIKARSLNPRLNLDKYDFWFIPVVNPDGYEYTHTEDRLWRKTRSPTLRQDCTGVDANRNYPFHWNESGSNPDPCDPIYAGLKPVSEPEVKAVKSIMDTHKNRILMYMSLHSYSQMLLLPYGYANAKPDNYGEIERAANAFTNVISDLRGTTYKYGSAGELLYITAGASDDYARGVANIRYSYTLELPDTGLRAFVLRASDIIPIGQETLLGLEALINALQ